jgi:branched-chain amino acid transport system substrate-binding protein
LKNTFPATWLCAAVFFFSLNGISSAQTIIVGRTLPLSGQLKTIGEPKRDGGDAYINKVNAAGGIGGRKIEVITLDDGYVADTTVANMRKLAKESKAIAFFSLLRLPVKDDTIPILEELKVPAIGVASATDILRSHLNRYGFPVRASFSDEARKTANHLKVSGITKIAVVYQDVALGLSTKGAMESALKEVALAPTIYKLDAPAQKVAEIARQIVDAQPQAVFLAALTPAVASLVSELKRIGYTGALYTFSSSDVFALNKLLGAKAVGIATSQVVPVPDSPRLKVVAEYMESVKQLGYSSPTLLGLEGYLEAKVLVEGLRRAGANPSPESLVKGLETMRELDLGGFFVTYTPQTHTGSLFVEIDMIGTRGELIR